MFLSNSNQVLTSTELATHAPAIFAQGAHASRSQRYGFVPTSEVLATLAADGWQPVSVGLKRAKTERSKLFGSHTLRLRHAEHSRYSATLQGQLELVLRNGHDGSSAIVGDLGIFRAICANGLVSATAKFGAFRIFHGTYAADKVRDAMAKMLTRAPALTETVDAWRTLALGGEEQRAFADAASQLRWSRIAAPVEPTALLTPRRSEDTSPDLWTTFNRVQENLLQGGLAGRASTGRRLTTRGVGAVAASHRLNQALWTLAEKMAELKGVKTSA